jgi:hypothetical protein
MWLPVCKFMQLLWCGCGPCVINFYCIGVVETGNAYIVIYGVFRDVYIVIYDVLRDVYVVF